MKSANLPFYFANIVTHTKTHNINKAPNTVDLYIRAHITFRIKY